MDTVETLDVSGKVVLVRVDFNVPLSNGVITDDTRIQAAVPTINTLRDRGAKVVLMSHMGRPKGQVSPEFSLGQIVSGVSKALGTEVGFCKESTGEAPKKAISAMGAGDVLLLENLRFRKEEESGDYSFARELADLGQVYINDAFGTAHRAHASTAVIAQFFTGAKGFGFIMANEIKNVSKVLNSTEKPVTAIVGGAKVSSKITILENLMPVVDKLIIGGGMAYTFFKAMGGSTGDSLVEEDKLQLALATMKLAKEHNVEFILPIDSRNGDGFSPDTPVSISEANEVPRGKMGLDIGPQSESLFSDAILSSRIILWNGPVGVFEFDAFEKGTVAIGKAIVEATQKGAFSLVGGGDSVAAAKKYGFAPKMSYVSTGGGAMLEYLEGKELPGIQAIMS